MSQRNIVTIDVTEYDRLKYIESKHKKAIKEFNAETEKLKEETQTAWKQSDERISKIMSGEGAVTHFKFSGNNTTVICYNPNDAVVELSKAIEQLTKRKSFFHPIFS